jgi:hypothetical protein
MASTIVIGSLACVCTCVVFGFRIFSRTSFHARLVPQLLQSQWLWRRLKLLRRRSFLLIMRIVWLLMSRSFTYTRLSLMRMLVLAWFWQLVWRIVLLLILWSLSRLIRYGLFFIKNMSLLDSLPILLLFIRSSFFDKVTLQLMTSLISFLLFGVSLTLLALSCLLSLASPAEIRRFPLSFV